MSRIFKKLLPDEDDVSDSIQLENPVAVSKRAALTLVVTPPPANARMVTHRSPKESKTKNYVLSLIFVVGLACEAQWVRTHPNFWVKRPVTAARLEKQVAVPAKAENLTEDLAQHTEAVRLFKMKDFAGAKLRFEKLIEGHPRSGALYTDLALTYLKLNEASEAKKLYQRALTLNPRDPVTLNNLGAYALSQKEYIPAAAYFKNAIKLKSEFLEAHLNLAIALESSGNMLGAVPEYAYYLQSPLARSDLKPILQKRMEKIKSFTDYYLKHDADEAAN